MSAIYQPRTNLRSRFERKAAQHIGTRKITPKLDQSIISFSFDDCPKSALTNAAPLLEAEGWLGTFYMAMGLCDKVNHLGLHMNQDDVKAAYDSGHEIADHTFSHIDGQQSPHQDFLADIETNQTALNALNIPFSRNFAYPYGCLCPKLKAKIAQKFELARGVHNPSFNSANKPLDSALLPSMRMYHNQTIDDIIRVIKTMEQTPQWLTVFTHDVSETPSNFGCTIADMEHVIQVIKDSGTRVMPMIEAYDYIQSKEPSSIKTVGRQNA
ncbi:MAG: polysaccharide deacetylase family protein [Litorimonas sp.]